MKGIFSSLIIFISLQFHSQSLLNGLQACYPLDLSAANSATTGAALNGTLVNVSPATGHGNSPNTAYQLNGTTNSYIELPDHAGLKNNSIFFSGWFYIDSLPNEQYLVYTSNGCFSNFEAYSLITYDDPVIGHQVFRLSKADASCNYAPQVSSTTTAQAGAWYHIGFFVSQDTMKLYVNGVLEGLASHSILFNYVNGKKVYLGVTNESNFNLPFKGRIDDVRFYNRQLTPTEVMMLYTGGGPCAGSAATASFSTLQGPVCRGQNFVLTNKSTNNPTAFSWQMPGGTPSVSAVNNPTVAYSNPGTYVITLVATNSFGSSTYTQTISISECIFINVTEQGSLRIKLYPNPNNGIFYVETEEANRIEVLDFIGRKVSVSTTYSSSIGYEVNMGYETSGIYFIKVFNSDNHLLGAKRILIAR